jgi:hypothetical protein
MAGKACSTEATLSGGCRGKAWQNIAGRSRAGKQATTRAWRRRQRRLKHALAEV